MSYIMLQVSYDEHRKIVNKPCSSCISSIEKPIGTPLSSSYQLELEEYLSHLRLSYYGELTNIESKLTLTQF